MTLSCTIQQIGRVLEFIFSDTGEIVDVPGRMANALQYLRYRFPEFEYRIGRRVIIYFIVKNWSEYQIIRDKKTYQVILLPPVEESKKYVVTSDKKNA